MLIISAYEALTLGCGVVVVTVVPVNVEVLVEVVVDVLDVVSVSVALVVELMVVVVETTVEVLMDLIEEVSRSDDVELTAIVAFVWLASVVGDDVDEVVVNRIVSVVDVFRVVELLNAFMVDTDDVVEIVVV
jgi:hypothetical protein